MEKLIHKTKWFWAWEDEKEELWLRDMAQQGFYLVSVKPFGAYYFKSGDNTDYVYRLDYRIDRKDMQNYLKSLRDDGWEHVCEMAGWQYFRKKAKAGGNLETQLDVSSKISKYKRLFGYLMIFIPAYAIIFSTIFNNRIYSWWGIVQILIAVLLVIWTYTIVRILLRIRQLQKAG